MFVVCQFSYSHFFFLLFMMSSSVHYVWVGLSIAIVLEKVRAALCSGKEPQNEL